jgi:4-azaleucine resistance transporter AzlC
MEASTTLADHDRCGAANPRGAGTTRAAGRDGAADVVVAGARAAGPQGAANAVAAGARAARPDGAASAAGGFAAGVRAVAPIAVAVVPFGASFGILARDAGMGVLAPIVMSLTTFAGSAQFAVASVLGSDGAVAAAIVAAVLLNLRYLAIGVSVAPALRGSPARRVAEAQLAVDESWAVAHRNGRVDRGRLLGAGTVLMACWLAGTVAGVLGGSALGEPADYGLDAMFPALFLALLAGQLDGRRARVAALSGGLIALALTPLLPPGLPIVAATLGAAIALTVRHVTAPTGAEARS